MALRVNTNTFSLNAQKNLAMHGEKLGGSFAKLSSGLRIVTAADDAAGPAADSTGSPDRGGSFTLTGAEAAAAIEAQRFTGELAAGGPTPDPSWDRDILDPLVDGHGRREARKVSLGGDDSKCREMRAEPVRHARGGGYILDKYKE